MSSPDASHDQLHQIQLVDHGGAFNSAASADTIDKDGWRTRTSTAELKEDFSDIFALGGHAGGHVTGSHPGIGKSRHRTSILANIMDELNKISQQNTKRLLTGLEPLRSGALHGQARGLDSQSSNDDQYNQYNQYGHVPESNQSSNDNQYNQYSQYNQYGHVPESNQSHNKQYNQYGHVPESNQSNNKQYGQYGHVPPRSGDLNGQSRGLDSNQSNNNNQHNLYGHVPDSNQSNNANTHQHTPYDGGEDVLADLVTKTTHVTEKIKLLNIFDDFEEHNQSRYSNILIVNEPDTDVEMLDEDILLLPDNSEFLAAVDEDPAVDSDDSVMLDLDVGRNDITIGNVLKAIVNPTELGVQFAERRMERERAADEDEVSAVLEEERTTVSGKTEDGSREIRSEEAESEKNGCLSGQNGSGSAVCEAEYREGAAEDAGEARHDKSKSGESEYSKNKRESHDQNRRGESHDQNHRGESHDQNHTRDSYDQNHAREPDFIEEIDGQQRHNSSNSNERSNITINNYYYNYFSIGDSAAPFRYANQQHHQYNSEHGNGDDYDAYKPHRKLPNPWAADSVPRKKEIYLITSYCQLFLNTSLYFVTSLLIVIFIRSLTQDLSNLFYQQKQEHVRDIAKCTQLFEINKCHLGIPNMVDQCSQWQNCMFEDADKKFINKTRIFVRLLAGLISDLLSGVGFLNVASLFMLLYSVYFTMNLFFGYVRGKSYGSLLAGNSNSEAEPLRREDPGAKNKLVLERGDKHADVNSALVLSS